MDTRKKKDILINNNRFNLFVYMGKGELKIDVMYAKVIIDWWSGENETLYTRRGWVRLTHSQRLPIPKYSVGFNFFFFLLTRSTVLWGPDTGWNHDNNMLKKKEIIDLV